MLKFSAYQFHKAGIALARIEERVAAEMEMKTANKHTVIFLANELRSLSEQLLSIGCNVSGGMAKGLAIDVDLHLEVGAALKAKVESLREAISFEAKAHLFLWVPAERSEFYSKTAKDVLSEKCVRRFPLIIPDINEGLKCYACERYTATAYHFTKGCEAPVRALAKALSITLGNNNWGAVFKAAQAQADSYSPRGKNLPPWDKHGEALLDILADMRAANKSWRNGFMHLDDWATREEAYYFLLVIPKMLNSIAERMNQKGKLF